MSATQRHVLWQEERRRKPAFLERGHRRRAKVNYTEGDNAATPGQVQPIRPCIASVSCNTPMDEASVHGRGLQPTTVLRAATCIPGHHLAMSLGALVSSWCTRTRPQTR